MKDELRKINSRKQIVLNDWLHHLLKTLISIGNFKSNMCIPTSSASHNFIFSMNITFLSTRYPLNTKTTKFCLSKKLFRKKIFHIKLFAQVIQKK